MNYRPIILCYHRVTEISGDDQNKLAVTPTNFRKQLEFLQTKRKFVSLHEMISDPKVNTVAVTFDDGYKDNFVIAANILVDLEIPTTFFLATRFIEHAVNYYTSTFNFVWSNFKNVKQFPTSYSGSIIEELLVSNNNYFTALKKLSSLDPESLWETSGLLATIQKDFGYLDELELPLAVGEVKSLLASDLFSIGPHTATHPRMSAISLNEAIGDFAESVVKTNEWSESIDLYFPYPFGQKSDFTLQLEQKIFDTYKFKGLSTFPSALNTRIAGSNTFPRLSVQNWSIEQFRTILNAANYFSFVPIAATIALKTSSMIRGFNGM